VNLSVTQRLPSTYGAFHPERGINAWSTHFTVTVERMAGKRAIPDATQTRKLHLRDFLVVSIGDSSASGQGNPDHAGEPAGFDPDLSPWDIIIPGALPYKLSEAAYKYAKNAIIKNQPQLARGGGFKIDMDPPAVWLEPRAYRSLRSSHAYAAKLCEDLTAGTVVTFLGFGRTGADINDGLLGPRTDKGQSIDDWANHRGEVGEVAAVLGQRRIDALIIQIGVNDMKVSATLTDLVENDFTLKGDDDAATKARKNAEATALKRLADLPNRFKNLAAALATLNVGQVYLVEYPTALFDGANGKPQHGCEVFDGPRLDLSKRDAELVKSLAHQLNGELANAATTYGWIFVTGVESRFQSHGYCRDGDDRWFRTCEESLIMQGDTEGTIHPNVTGHMEIGRQIAPRIQKYTIDATPVIAPENRDSQEQTAG
jgi:lysophospholipase L1-like esterase